MLHAIGLNIVYNHFVREIDVLASWEAIAYTRELACHSTGMIRCLAGWVSKCGTTRITCKVVWHSSVVDALTHLMLKGCVFNV